MKTREILLFVILVSFSLMISCKKDKQESTKVDETVLNTTVDGATKLSAGIQSFMLSTMSAAIDSGLNTKVPSIDTKKKSLSFKKTYDYAWIGPDADGWYTRSMSGIYEYYEKIRYRDTIDYIIKISYNGADETYENTTTTKFIKYTKDKKVLYKGYNNWELYSSGYSNISRVTWKMTFEDWNPSSSAGTYDWYWGVSENSGGNTVAFHRFEHLIATESKNNWLHCHTYFYDEGNTEIWNFEYDIPWSPVEMPDIPEVN